MVTINGKTYYGNNIKVSNNKVIIDGKDATPEDTLKVNILVEGDIQRLEVDVAEKIAIGGYAGSVNTQSGSVEVRQHVVGSVETVSGSVKIQGDVHKNVQTVSGSVKTGGSIGGNVTSVSGSIKKALL